MTQQPNEKKDEHGEPIPTDPYLRAIKGIEWQLSHIEADMRGIVEVLREQLLISKATINAVQQQMNQAQVAKMIDEKTKESNKGMIV